MPAPPRSSPRRSHSPPSTGPNCCSATRNPDPRNGRANGERAQRDALDRLLRDAPLDLGGDVAEQRIILQEMMAAIPLPADVTTSPGSLGGIPVVSVETANADVILYLHGGAYAIGTAASSVGPASDLARRAGAGW